MTEENQSQNESGNDIDSENDENSPEKYTLTQKVFFHL